MADSKRPRSGVPPEGRTVGPTLKKMISIRNLSIPNRIVAIIVIVSSAALLLTGAALVGYDVISARRDLNTTAQTLADVIADNMTAPVQFQDRKAAAETLNSVHTDPSILAACIYSNSELFLEHVVGAASCPKQRASRAQTWGSLVVSSSIHDGSKISGAVQLHASMKSAYAHLRLEIITIALILGLASLFAYGLSARLQKVVSEPILDLTQTANDVSRRKDYSIRAVKQNEDELGVLVDAFNDMLAQIQTRDVELRERTSDLARANRMKDEFLATLSHELRTPLTSILAWAVMLRSGLSGDRRSAALEAIERNARLQARLIEDLLDVSRIISGKFTMDSSEVGLNQIIESAVDVVRPAAEAKRIRVRFQPDSDVTHVLGDAARLQQAVWNLLANAVKFTAERGSVDVRLEKVNGHVRVSVTDNGIGIAPEFLPFVFDRFRQADGSSARTHGGLGLGLAIVRHIVEMHGGSVNVESEGKGRGTTFTIELPLVASEIAGPQSNRMVG